MTTGSKNNQYRKYLGDGVYADFNGYGLVLTTEDGTRVTNTIVLEHDVYAGLLRYVDWLKRNREAHNAT